MPRTGSIASKVGPAVITTLRPASSFGWKKAIRCSSSSSGSSILPMPVSPQAWSPAPGPTTVAPSAASCAMLRCVAGCSHIWRFIAGATSSGHSRARHSVVSRSSAMPWTSFAMRSAVAGAIRIGAAPRVRSICAMLLSTRGSQRSDHTGLPDNAWKVTGVTKRAPPAVSATCTSAPAFPSSRTSSAALYAATPPVTPSTIRRPLNSLMAYSV